jgi:hypothetical protein
MTYIIFIIVAAAVVVLGTVYVRKQHKKLKDARERKIRIASGQEVEPEPVKRSRLLGLIGRQPVSPVVPPAVEERIRNAVPPAIDAVLQHWHALRDAVEKARAADDAVSQHGAGGVIYSTAYDRPSVDSDNVLRSLAATHLKERRAQREALLQRERFSQELLALAHANHALEEALVGHHFVDFMPPDLVAIVTTGKQVLLECQKPNSQPRDPKFLLPLAEPAEVSSEADDLLRQTTQAALALSGALLAMRQAFLETSRRSAALNLGRDWPTLDEPTKPNDGEVQEWMAAAIEWSQRSFDLEQPFAEGQQLLRSTLADTKGRIADLLAALEALRALDKAHTEEQRKLPVVETMPPPVTAPPGTVAASAKPEPEPVGSVKAVEPRPVKTPVVALLTDVQGAQWRAAEVLQQFAGSEVDTYQSPLDTWSRVRLHQSRQPGETPPPADAEKNRVAQVRAAMRKLGFALAQRNSAQQKLAAEEAQPADVAELDQPTLDEINVEMYVRSHRRWCKDKAANADASAARSKRIESFRQQAVERESQVANAASALSSLLQQPPASLEQAVVLRAAQAMVEQAEAEEEE